MSSIQITQTQTPRINIVLDRGVAGVGIESVIFVDQNPNYFLEFTYTNGTTELVPIPPSITAGVQTFNTRAGAVTLTSGDVTDALTYTPVQPNGTGATGTWTISISGNAATATNVPYTGLTGTVPTWNQSTTGNAATVTNGVYTTDTGTVTNTMLAGSIANNKLTNSAITVNGTSTALGGSVNVGTVTSVAGTGTVNGISLSGTVTDSGSLTLGGALSNVSLTTQVTGTLPIANGGTNATTASGARTSLGLGTAAVLDSAVALGAATLDAGGTVPLNQIPASIQGGLNYQGAWNATTNTPTLTSSVGSKGHYYAVSVAGSTNLNGITNWNIGDLAVYNGTAWDKIDNTDAVTSVNGFTGTVVLSAADVGAYSDTNPSGYTTNTGTVTSVGATAGTGISVTGSPITSSGTLTITNTAPDQVVSLTGAGTTAITGTYPNFTITSNDSATGTVTSVGGTGTVNGISLSGSVTTSGSLTLGGALSGVNLTTQVTGTLPVANGGTGATAATGTGNVVLATSPTVSGAILNDGYTEEVFAVTGTTPALSPANGTIQTWTLTGNSTPTAGTWNAGQSITLMIDDGTAYTVTWSSLAVTWKTDGGVAPTLNTTGFTVITLWKVGATIYGARVGDA